MLSSRLACSFCGRSAAQVEKLVAGRRAYICDRCAQETIRIMQESSAPPAGAVRPSFGRRVFEAVRALCRASRSLSNAVAVTARQCALVLLLATAAGAQTGTSPATIDSVRWLQGCWTTEAAAETRRGQVVEEQWMTPRGGAMLGMSRTVRDGKLVEFELVVLSERDGRLAYHAHPSGQPGAVFLSTDVTASSALFENPQHDFPQKIGYRSDGDSLVAWIEGTRNGQARRVEFPYRRARCGA